MSQEEKLIDAILEEFGDGFQWSDIGVILPKLMEWVESFTSLDSAAKKQKVLNLVKIILDKTDGPGPDWLVDRGLMWFLPGVIDGMIGVYNGNYDLG